MIETVRTMFEVAYHLRWVLVAAGAILAGIWVAVLVDQRNTAEKRAARLRGELARERSWVRHLEAEAAADRRTQIVALPGRRETSNG